MSAGGNPEMQPPDIDRTRLNELYLYIAQKTRDEGHPGLGRIRIAKLLFLVDFGAYFRLGESVTGAHYVADELGPAPTEELLAIRDLETQGRLEMQPGYDRQEIPVALEPPDTDVFTPEQLEHIDRLIERYRDFTSAQLVDVAHEFPGWIFAYNKIGPKSPVPYESAFWGKRKQLTSEEQAHAENLAREFGLTAG
jgi:hypothetical protein